MSASLRSPGLEREWRAAREGCALFAPTHRALIVARGDDRLTFLQGMLSNDVKSLAVGAGVYAAFLTQAGKIVSDLRVFGDQGRVLILLPASRATAVKEGLERFIVADDVELEISSVVTPLVGLEGPTAADVVERILGERPAAGEDLALRQGRFQSEPVAVLSTSEIDGRGYLLCGSSTLAAPLLEAARAGGALMIGMEALNLLRVEAGIPWYGRDMDEDVLLMEAGLERAVSFTKGCYLGQEVVERIAARGHVNRKLCGLVIDGSTVPEPGATLHHADRDVGHITSAVRSLALDHVIALGYVHRSRLEPGTALQVSSGSERMKATVTALPFVPSTR